MDDSQSVRFPYGSDRPVERCNERERWRVDRFQRGCHWKPNGFRHYVRFPV